MKSDLCIREDELLDALTRGFVGAELKAHLATCGPCAELQTVAGALLEDQREASIAAAVPSSSAMWRRMQLRHRNEAEAAARRSLIVGQTITFAVVVFLAVSLLGTQLTGSLFEVIAAIRFSTPLLVAVATWVILGPVAGYIAARQK